MMVKTHRANHSLALTRFSIIKNEDTRSYLVRASTSIEHWLLGAGAAAHEAMGPERPAAAS
jgi:hypothetical protein